MLLKKQVIIEAKNISKHFPVKEGPFSKSTDKVHALDKINLKVFQNEVVGLVGESGSGKSTLARVLLQLIEPTEGTILFEEKDVTSASNKEIRFIRKDMQIVFQDPFASLNPRKKVLELIKEPLDIHKVGTKQERIRKVHELLEVVGLRKEVGNRYPHEFSGGQRQRIGIARSLALNPKLIICDEPVSALDVSVQAQILNLLQDLKEEFGLTYIFIAHGLDVVRHISDRVAVMYLGKIVEFGESEDVFTNPQHPYTKALISAIPKPGQITEESSSIIKGEIPSPIHPPSGCRFHTRCPLAFDTCKVLEPVLNKRDGSGYAACHLLQEKEDASLVHG